MNFSDDVGTREHEKIIVPLKAIGVVAETCAPKVLFPEARSLDHGPHRAVEKQNALLEKPAKPLCRRIVAHPLSFRPCGPTQ